MKANRNAFSSPSRQSFTSTSGAALGVSVGDSNGLVSEVKSGMRVGVQLQIVKEADDVNKGKPQFGVFDGSTCSRFRMRMSSSAVLYTAIP